MNPSIKDVAKLACTSIATVSNVLNGTRNVSSQLQKRVKEAADQLGYVVNPIARNLKTGSSDTVAVIIADINCIFFAPFLKSIERVLSAAGYSMTISDANFSQESLMKSITHMKGQRIKGIIVCGMMGDECLDFYKKYIEDGNQKITPIINVESDLSRIGIDSVFIDYKEASRIATNHLVELGCRRILHIAGETGLCSPRLEGYKAALLENEIPIDDELIHYGTMMPISGYNVMQHILRYDIPIDGVFAANDQMAIGALRALLSANISVPDSVKVVGFDNAFISSIVTPALTTISVPNYEMGKTAANLLLERISSSTAPAAAVCKDFELLIRRSTVRTSRTNWEMEYW